MKRLSNLLLVLGLITAMGLVTSCNKKGCTDPLSSNYDPDATKDDGSCVYDENPGRVITDDGSGTGTVTWSADTTYFLDGFVFVNSGQTLTIEAGTVIKGLPGSGADASALIVAKGATIMAEGTATNPIIFTAEIDDVDDPNDIPEGTRGLWGGLIILGDASLNSTPGESAIEGLPTTESRGLYGGSNDADNSGTLRYISLRYGGSDIGAGNEINGVTFGGVGSGTTVDHIEVIYNQDDGFEFFGGTVNTKYLASVFCGDDAFDYDEGFRGKGQFWFVLQASDDGDRGGEHDGGTAPEDGTPFATPMVYNATFIGRGASEGKRTITFRDNAGGEYHNSIFVEYDKGIDIEHLGAGEHSYARYEAGDLVLENNIFWNVAGNTADDVFTISGGSSLDPTDSTAAVASVQAYFATAGNMVMDPGLTIGRSSSETLNPIPSESAVLSGATPATDGWFTSATYKGAFGTGDNWCLGWTLLSEGGFFE